MNGEDGVEPDSELLQRLDQLTARVNTLATLVEGLFDRLEPVSDPAPLTAEELADIAARMVRLIESRLEAHTERLGQVIGELTTRGQAIAAAEEVQNFAMLQDHIAMIGRGVLDMQRTLSSISEAQSPLEFQEMAILEHVDRWFEETNSRLASDVAQIRRDFHRFDQTILEVRDLVGDGPHVERRDRSEMLELLEEASGERLGSGSVPVARLDDTALERLDARLEEVGLHLTQKIDDGLAARLQRFEALSQAMITLVGDPVDALTEKLQQLAHEREPGLRAAQSIQAIEAAQVQIAANLSALRHEGLEREALLRHALNRLSNPDTGDARD
ncbi:MAG TPA: hypothetical protein VGZ52_08560 [Acidimicrobiales bacterium]|nr:hypothetical protein [Acidimicrobiales bacterium]